MQRLLDILVDSIIWILAGCISIAAVLWGSTILMQLTGQ